MAATDKFFAGSIPEIYERFLVPLIFESYALDLAKRVADTEPRDVLETAAGTGVLTRAMVSRLPAATRIVATDLNQPMLDQAAKRQKGERQIGWRQADAMALPFPTESFDVVACQFGAMFFPDKIQAHKEARRVLRSGGHLIFNVWDRISENEFADVVTQALAEIFPHDPPRFMARIPHGYHDMEQIRRERTERSFRTAVDAVERKAERRRRAIRPSRTARARRCAMKSRRATLRAWSMRRRKPRRWFGNGPIEGRIRAFAITAG